MRSKALITGPPRCGKSTLIQELISYYLDKNYKISGFLTPEVIEKNNRIGFNALNIQTKRKIKLARIGNYKSDYNLGKYHVFVNEFENFISEFEFFSEQKLDLIILDEIGKMELFSIKFRNLIKRLFESGILIIATISLKLNHPIKNYILNLPNVILFNLNHQNKNEIFQKITSIIFI